MGNAFGYVQLHTADLDRARRFYGELFDWTLDDTGDDDAPYIEIRVGEGVAGGMMTAAGDAPVSRWVPYVQVDDVGRAADSAVALGGTLVAGPTRLPDGSWYAVLIDPTGAPFALHGPNPQ